MFKIHAILPTNNEADILEECLEAASLWADYIYVFDTGSNDDTWSIVNRLAENNPKIIPYLSEYRPYNFTKTLGEVFSHYFHKSQKGDWWCTLCTDEQYLEDPRIFLAKLDSRYDSVWSSTLQYYYTNRDFELFNNSNPGGKHFYKHSERLSWYRNNYSEVRFYKHGPSTKKSTLFLQKNFPKVSPNRIAMQHFQFRTPQQIIKRVRSRQKIFDGDPLMQFAHEKFWKLGSDGKQRVELSTSLFKDSNDLTDSEILNLRMVPEVLLHQDLKNGKYKFEPDLLPQLPIHWSEPILMLKSLIKAHSRLFITRFKNFIGFVIIRIRKY